MFRIRGDHAKISLIRNSRIHVNESCHTHLNAVSCKRMNASYAVAEMKRSCEVVLDLQQLLTTASLYVCFSEYKDKYMCI